MFLALNILTGSNGHFSFFEYSNFNYLERFKQLFDIFGYNDTDKEIQD